MPTELGDEVGFAQVAQELAILQEGRNLVGGQFVPGEFILSIIDALHEAIDFIEQYSRKRQLFINTNVNGDLEFFKASGVNLGKNVCNIGKHRFPFICCQPCRSSPW